MARTLSTADRSDVGAFAPILRSRLTQRLKSSAAYPITLLVAPAGYGKSVALRQYLAEAPEQHAYFALRDEHSSLLAFVRGLLDALRVQAPHAMSALAGAYERSAASPKRAAALARWLHAHLESFDGIVAVDDIHVGEPDPEIAEFLTSLIERTKGRIRWMLASRSTIQLPIATWVAYGDAELPIDEHELRFTAEEARAAAKDLRLPIGDAELGELLALTEGWPAAMTFALRTSTRSTELRNVSALTREMVFRLLAEQIYCALATEERELLEVAIALPLIDVSVLELAGFDRALTVLERLRERTAFIYEDAPGQYGCHDLFRDFIRREAALRGRRSQQIVHERAAHALERAGDVEHALTSYSAAGSTEDVLRLLEAKGFDLLERARGDVVARAIDSLDEKVRRENAAVLALQGALAATAGRFARAESLFRRALERAGDDLDLVAITSLRLASLMANQGSDATALLRTVGENPRQTASRRAEALSLMAAQRAVGGDEANAKAAIAEVERLADDVDSDAVRAKALHYTGIAFHHLGMAAASYRALTQCSELAGELHLYSLTSRANAVLSNLVLHEYDDVERQLQYAEAAAAAADKAGDAFALQTALLQMLSAQMRRGSIERSIEIEERLAGIRKSDLAYQYLSLFRAMRLAWEGRFAEAHQLVASCWEKVPHDFDRLVCGTHYALFLALDGQASASTRLTAEMLASLSAVGAGGLFRMRAVAVAVALCAVVEAINGRISQASRVLRKAKGEGDPIVALVTAAADEIITRLRCGTESRYERIRECIDRLKAAGYADLGLLLASVTIFMSHRQREVAARGPLTSSEINVLQLLADGLTPKEIAERDGRSVFTVRVHIANVIAKLGCRGRSDAVRTAQRLGLI